MKGLKTGGRRKGTQNKATVEIKDLARRHGPEAITALCALAREGEREETRRAAWNDILDRGYGRPSQSSDINLKGDLSVIVATGVPKLANGDR